MPRDNDLLDPRMAASLEALIESGDEPRAGLISFLWVDIVTGDADLDDVFAVAIDAQVALRLLRPEDADPFLAQVRIVCESGFFGSFEIDRGHEFLLLGDVLDAITAHRPPQVEDRVDGMLQRFVNYSRNDTCR